jgi:hypothetical protein
MISKKVISLFTFGIFLLVAGVILNFVNNPQANLLMAIGLLFELLAALLFIWNKLKK